jgi:hypothetical protein
VPLLRAVFLVSLLLLLPAAAGQARGTASGGPAATVDYRIVAVSHSSSSRENDPPIYVGSSTATWSLAPATKAAPNTLSVTTGPFTLGLGRVNIRGVFKAEARTNRTNGHCSLTAATGSKKYPAVAPGPFSLAVGADPKSAKRVLVTQGLGFNVYASLSNPYFPSECSTSVSGEPGDARLLVSVPKTLFTQKTVVLRFAGATRKDGIAYRWSTVFTLKRLSSGR